MTPRTITGRVVGWALFTTDERSGLVWRLEPEWHQSRASAERAMRDIRARWREQRTFRDSSIVALVEPRKKKLPKVEDMKRLFSR